ncbi:MAG: DUF2867 domain-containing protein, partial [Usitatibacteraceae bacterium]
ALMRARDALVSGLGIKTSEQLQRVSAAHAAKRIGIFRIYSSLADEIILGEDDRHLDFRLSVMCTPPQSPTQGYRLTLSTVVHCHNRVGRLYIFLIAPFHRAVVRSYLRRAARAGWPRAEEVKP